MCESERHTRGLLFQFQEVVVKCRHSTRLPILLFALNCGRVCHPRSAVRDSLPPSFKKKLRNTGVIGKRWFPREKQ